MHIRGWPQSISQLVNTHIYGGDSIEIAVNAQQVGK